MSTPATLLYLRLDSDYEPVWNGPSLTDRDAVAQAIMTRLKLFQGEWWEDLNEGLPLFQQILGQPNGNNTDLIVGLIRSRIEGTPYVLQVSNIAASYDHAGRQFKFSCDVITQFGVITITNVPEPPQQGVLSE